MHLGDETADVRRLNGVESVLAGQLADQLAEDKQITPVVTDRMRRLSSLLGEFVEVDAD